ncbi:MAG TPA: type II CAAX endopeptidase family protein [Bryobacteraceae bacterium]|nr:type II CAAX endopeptidase family protein [Bryobacteraceae bacterium]
MSSEIFTLRSAGGTNRTGSSRQQLLELLVFLFLMVPSIVLSYFALHAAQPSFDFIAAATMLRELALVSLIAFFLWRNREPMTLVGWTARGAIREIAIGVLLFPMALFIGTAVNQWLRTAGLSGTTPAIAHSMTPVGVHQLVLSGFLVAVVAVCEETIFRGYLFLRLQSLTGSTAAGAFLSTILFAAGHGYEGVAGVSTVFTLGLVLVSVYLWRKSLIAPVVIHFLQDFLSIILLPVLLRK